MSDQNITNLIIKDIDTVSRGINIHMTNGDVFQIRPPKDHYSDYDHDNEEEIYNYEVNFYKNSSEIDKREFVGKTIQKTVKIDNYSYKFIINHEEYIVSINSYDFRDARMKIGFFETYDPDEHDPMVATETKCNIFLLKQNKQSHIKRYRG